jgi:hypothetical protein
MVPEFIRKNIGGAAKGRDLLDHLVHQLGDVSTGESAAGEIRNDPPPLGLARQGAELCRPLLRQRERYNRPVTALRPVSRQRPLDQRPVDPHREQITGQPGGTPPSSGSTFDVATRKGCVVEQSQLGRARDSRLNGDTCMSLPLEPSGEVALGIRAYLESPQDGSECRLDVGGSAQALVQNRIELATYRQALRADHLTGHGTKTISVDLQPNRARPAGIGFQSGNSRRKGH